jgi:PAS domain S-box-containing protein
MDNSNKIDENCHDLSINTNFEEIFYQSPIGIFFYDKKGRLTNANDSALKIARIPKLEDVLGTNIFDNPKIASKKDEILDKGLIKFQDTLDLIEIKEQNIYNPVESQIIDIFWTVSVTDSGYLIQIQDITESKKALEQIDLERRRLKIILETIPSAVVLVESNGTFSYFNKGAIDLYGIDYVGYDLDSHIAKVKAKKLDGTPFPLDEMPVSYSLKFGENVHGVEMIIERDDGKQIPVLVSSAPLFDINGKITKAIVIFEDITEQKKVEKEIIGERNILNVIIESAEGPIFSVDCNYRYSSFNSQHAKVMKTLFDADIEMGGNLLDYHTNHEDRKNAKINIDKVLNGETVIIESFAGDSSQNRQYFSIFHTPIKDSNGKINGVAVYAQDHSERKEAEEALKKSEAQLREAQRLSKVGNWEWSLENDIVTWSDELYNIAGLNLERSAPNYEEHPKFYTKESFSILDRAVKNALKTGEPYNLLLELIRVDGEHRWVDAHGEVIKNAEGQVIGFRGTVQDINERKKVEEALKHSEIKLRDTLESITDGFFSLDKDWVFTYINQQAAANVGFKSEYLIGKRIWDVFPKIVGTKHESTYRIVMEKKEFQSFDTIDVITKKFYNIRVYPSVEGISVYWQDITERKKAEEKMKITLDELKRSNIELERFAYVSSHDLQEPLRMVTLYSQLLERRYKDSLDSDADDFIEYIIDNAKRMKQLIDDLLEYSRVTSQAKEFENVDLEKILDIVLTNLSVFITENNAKVIYEPLPTVYADKNQMLQVFQNLITNAIKFRGDKSPEINISAQRGQTEWIFSVSDNGIGIKPEHQKQIFDVFKRLHTRDEYPGTGIGLSIVQKIITHHDGRIWVESEPGKGSTFYFTIPDTQ